MFGTSIIWILAAAGAVMLGLLAWRHRAAIIAYFDRTASANPFRMAICLVLALSSLGVVGAASPVQLAVIAYKLSLVLLAGYLGYWMDFWLFPYARPDSYLRKDWQAEQGFKAGVADHAVAPGYEGVFAAALIRRAIIVGMFMLGMGLAL